MTSQTADGRSAVFRTSTNTQTRSTSDRVNSPATPPLTPHALAPLCQSMEVKLHFPAAAAQLAGPTRQQQLPAFILDLGENLTRQAALN